MPTIKHSTTTLYTFDELTDRAKERARDWFREGIDTQDYAEHVIEDAARMADLLGIDLRSRTAKLMGGGTRQEPEVYWSGFSSQGDGACFVGSYAYKKGSVQAIASEAPRSTDGTRSGNDRLNDIAVGLRDVQKRHFYRLTATVRHTGRYSHEHSTTIEVFDGENDASAETADTVAELMRDFMRWIYSSLEQEYNYRMSDSTVDEDIRANEYTFNEDGNRED